MSCLTTDNAKTGHGGCFLRQLIRIDREGGRRLIPACHRADFVECIVDLNTVSAGAIDYGCFERILYHISFSALCASLCVVLSSTLLSSL